MKNKRIESIKFCSVFRTIFSYFALYIILFSTVMISNIFFVDGSEITDALITYIDRESVPTADGFDYKYTVYLRYTVNDIEYNSTIREYDSSMETGKAIKVYYDKEDPSIVSTVTATKIMIILPVILLTIYIVLVIRKIIKFIISNIRKRKIIANDYYITANYQVNISDEGRYLSCITFNPIKNIEQEFISDYFKYDNNLENGNVKIYIDNNNYYIDLNSININNQPLVLKRHNCIEIRKATISEIILFYVIIAWFIFLIYQLYKEQSGLYDYLVLISTNLIFLLPILILSKSGFPKGKRKYKKLMKNYKLINLIGKVEVDQSNKKVAVICTGVNPYDNMEMDFIFLFNLANPFNLNENINVDIYVSMSNGDYYTDLDVLKNKVLSIDSIN